VALSFFISHAQVLFFIFIECQETHENNLLINRNSILLQRSLTYLVLLFEEMIVTEEKSTMTAILD
jgi:hypothetical protein